MNLGFVKVGAFSPEIKVADVDFNVKQIVESIKCADKKGVKVLAFPELCITGSTLGDLFYSDTLLKKAKNALIDIAIATEETNLIVFVGLPFKKDGVIYNVCACISNGSILGFVPKTYMTDSDYINQKRYFESCVNGAKEVFIEEASCPDT